MAYGPKMQFAVGDHTVLMRPFRQDEAERFLVGMQSLPVIRTIGLWHAQTLENEEEFLKRTAEDENALAWAITVVSDEYPDGLAIGTSSLHLNRVRQFASTGSVIFDRSWWRKGIAKHAHMARTYYAFTALGLLGLESSYLRGNEASSRALRNSGYDETGGFQLRFKCIEGAWEPIVHLLCVNPLPGPWEYAWDGVEIEPRFVEARRRTQSVLEWASNSISWP